MAGEVWPLEQEAIVCIVSALSPFYSVYDLAWWFLRQGKVQGNLEGPSSESSVATGSCWPAHCCSQLPFKA